MNIIICVLGCATINKYKSELLKIKSTWGIDAALNNIKVLYMLGEEKTDLDTDEFIYLKNVKNDYLSASYKQNLGLKYIYENYNADFVFCCGSDTFVNIKNLILLLKNYNHSEALYIGGHGDVRKINNENIYFHSGGPGFILSRKSMEILYPYFEDMINEWHKICNLYNYVYLLEACDVCIAYYAKKFNFLTIKNENFFYCNFRGYPCHLDTFIDITKLISCHSMTLQDFDELYNLLKMEKLYIHKYNYI